MYMHMLVYILLYASIFFQTFKLQKLSMYMKMGFVESLLKENHENFLFPSCTLRFSHFSKYDSKMLS